MSGISTHVLDTARGVPAAGVAIVLEREAPGGGWQPAGRGETDADGRVGVLLAGPLEAARYRLTFATRDYFRAQGTRAFYPEVRVDFEVDEPGRHHHVPLLLSPYGYSTYRGS